MKQKMSDQRKAILIYSLELAIFAIATALFYVRSQKQSSFSVIPAKNSFGSAPVDDI